MALRLWCHRYQPEFARDDQPSYYCSRPLNDGNARREVTWWTRLRPASVVTSVEVSCGNFSSRFLTVELSKDGENYHPVIERYLLGDRALATVELGAAGVNFGKATHVRLRFLTVKSMYLYLYAGPAAVPCRVSSPGGCPRYRACPRTACGLRQMFTPAVVSSSHLTAVGVVSVSTFVSGGAGTTFVRVSPLRRCWRRDCSCTMQRPIQSCRQPRRTWH